MRSRFHYAEKCLDTNLVEELFELVESDRINEPENDVFDQEQPLARLEPIRAIY